MLDFTADYNTNILIIAASLSSERFYADDFLGFIASYRDYSLDTLENIITRKLARLKDKISEDDKETKQAKEAFKREWAEIEAKTTARLNPEAVKPSKRPYTKRKLSEAQKKKKQQEYYQAHKEEILAKAKARRQAKEAEAV